MSKQMTEESEDPDLCNLWICSNGLFFFVKCMYPLLPLLEDYAEILNEAVGELMPLGRWVEADLYRLGLTEGDVIILESPV